MRILVDTNVIIDALTGREPFRETAEQIFMLAANQTEDMHIIASSTTDIYFEHSKIKAVLPDELLKLISYMPKKRGIYHGAYLRQ